MSIKFVWFDCGLTLLDCNDRFVYQNAMAAAGFVINQNDVSEAYGQTNRLCMRRKNVDSHMRYAGFPDLLLDQLGVSMNVEQKQKYIAYLEEHRGVHRWTLYPWTMSVLQKLHASGYRTGLLSNWDLSLRDLLDETGLSDELDPLVISSEVKIEKPDPRIFEEALKMAGVSGKNCIYVGDNYYDDVIGARKAGMQPLLLNASLWDQEDLTDVGMITTTQDILPWLAENDK